MTPASVCARSWRRSSLLLLRTQCATLALAIAASISCQVAVVRADDAAILESLRKEKLATAKEWHKGALEAFAAGTVRCTALYESSLAWKEADYELARDKNERLHAL